MIKSVMAAFRDIEQDARLGGAFFTVMPNHLKQKVDQRSDFARAALECGETMLKKHIVHLEEKIANVDEEAAKRSAAVAGATQSLESAKKRRATSATAVKAVHRKIERGERTEQDLESKLDALGNKQGELAGTLESERARLSSFVELCVKFDALKERSNVPVPVTPPRGSADPAPVTPPKVTPKRTRTRQQVAASKASLDTEVD